MRWIVTGLAISVVFAPAGVLADSWQQLDGPAIQDVLTDRTVEYPAAVQVFYASGRTKYTTFEDSWGTWSVRGSQYCSTWPPNPDWQCYEMFRDGDQLRWVDQWGSASEGRLRPEGE